MNGDGARPATGRPADELGHGLDSPICLTWEVTYGATWPVSTACRARDGRDRRELSTAEAVGFIDELAAMRVFYVNVGGGEPLLRPDFFDLVEHATRARIGVKFSTNGTLIGESRARRLALMDYVDVQVSVDGARPASNDPVRGAGSFEAAMTALARLSEAGLGGLKLTAVVTRLNVGELDDLLGLARRYGAQLRLARLRPAGRGAKTWQRLRPTAQQLVELHRFLVEHPEVLTGDSFFHLGALGEPLAGLNMCGAGRVVCLVDPVGDVYACPSSCTLSSGPGACGTRAASPRSGGRLGCSQSCASLRPAAPATPAARSTPATAVAWPRSSSRACLWRVPTPSAFSGTGRWRSGS